jgi:ABC-type uncharacterized transport system permease subunit
MFSTPLLIYVGIISPSGWAAAIGVQAVWAAVLAFAASFMWRAGTRRIVSQGG